MPATPIAAMSLRFTPNPPQGYCNPAHREDIRRVLLGLDLVFNGLDQHRELGLDL